MLDCIQVPCVSTIVWLDPVSDSHCNMVYAKLNSTHNCTWRCMSKALGFWQVVVSRGGSNGGGSNCGFCEELSMEMSHPI